MPKPFQESATAPKQELLAGIRTILPIGLGVAIYALAFGLLASQAGLTSGEVGIMGLLVFAGSSQIVAVERLAAPSICAISSSPLQFVNFLKDALSGKNC